jgi:hypothetical protein
MNIALSISYVKAPDVIPTAVTISPASPLDIVPVYCSCTYFRRPVLSLKIELMQLIQQRLQAMHKIILISLRLETRYLYSLLSLFLFRTIVVTSDSTAIDSRSSTIVAPSINLAPFNCISLILLAVESI